MDFESHIPGQPSELINVSQLCGKGLLLVGHVDFKKNIWTLASDLGLKCYVVGPTPPKTISEQVERYFCYDLDDHTNDQTHCDVIVRWVTSEVGDVDGCLTLYDACVPLTALICARLQKVGIPFHGAMAAQQKGLTFEALREYDQSKTGFAKKDDGHRMPTAVKKASSTDVTTSMWSRNGTNRPHGQGLIIPVELINAQNDIANNHYGQHNDNDELDRHRMSSTTSSDQTERSVENACGEAVLNDSPNSTDNTGHFEDQIDCTANTDHKESSAGNAFNQQGHCHRGSRSTKDCGLSKYTSRCVSVAREQDLIQASSLVGFPAVLKMEYGGGARGVRQVHSLQESQQHFRHLQQMCQTSLSSEKGMHRSDLGLGFKGHCVLMELLEGSEHCVDLVAYHGELLLAVVTDKGPPRLPDTFHTVHVMPSLLTPNRLNDVITASWDCCKGLGLSHGVFNVEVMLASSGPKLIEINHRMGGFGQRDFARHCYNLDFFVMACMVAADIKPQIAGFLSPSSAFESYDPTHAQKCNKSVSPQLTGSISSADVECDAISGFAFACESDIPSATQNGNEMINLQRTATVQSSSERKQDTVSTGIRENRATSIEISFDSSINSGMLLEERSLADKSAHKTLQEPAVPMPPVPTPRALCFTVGLFLYPLHHGAALKTTARPETLRRLHDQGELLFLQIEETVIEKAYEPPFCIVAVKGHSFEEARATLENLCLRLGIDAPELREKNYAY